MQFKINRILIVITITAFAMIYAPTLTTINTIFAATFNPFDNPIFDGVNIKNKDSFNINTPDSINSKPQSDNTPTSDNSNSGSKPQSDNTPTSDNSNSGSKPSSEGQLKECIPGKCLGTKGFYTDIGHHHCFAGVAGCSKTH